MNNKKVKLIMACIVVVVIAAILFYFLRQGSQNEDIADSTYSRGVALELEGDSNYFVEAFVEPLYPDAPAIRVSLPPREPYYLLPGSYNATLSNGKRAMGIGEDVGYIERWTDDGWEFVCDAAPWGDETAVGGDDRYFSLRWDGSGPLQGIDLYAPFFDSPGEYRFTVNFREVKPSVNEKDLEGWLAEDEVHSVSFRYTVPEPTDPSVGN